MALPSPNPELEEVIDDLLQHLHNALCCPICCGRFEIPLVLRTCGHSFCASCIRTNLDHQQGNNRSEGLTCPLCRKGCDDRDLIANVVLREVVEQYEKGKEVAGKMLVERLLELKAGPSSRPAPTNKPTNKTTRAKRRRAGDTVCIVVEDSGGVHIEESARDCQIEEARVDGEDWVDSQSLSQSSGEEYLPTKEGKGAQDGSLAKTVSRRTAPARGAQSHVPGSSFLPCPVCGKDIHHMYMNSHIDACLARGGEAGADPGQGAQGRAPPKSRPLDVPPKLVMLGGVSNPQNEKKLKNELKKYNVPVEGCSTPRELFDRYTRFRTAVEVSNDKGEVGATYEKIIFRLMKEDRNKKMAGMFGKKNSTFHHGTPGSDPAPAVGGRSTKVAEGEAVTIDMTAARTEVTEGIQRVQDRRLARDRIDDIDLSQMRHPRDILLPDDATFSEMVRVTMLRDKLRTKLLEEFNE
jgi:hypothetical protein